jgi:SAM-dependent methyltransferase
MKIDKCLHLLKHPDSNAEAEFAIEDNFLVDKNSQKKYPIINNMVDFSGSNIDDKMISHNKKGLLFRLNTLFGKYLDVRILTSIFAGGGITFSIGRRKTKKWFDRIANDITLFLDPADRDILSHIGSENCITVDDFNSKNVLPGQNFYPDLNASFEQIPIKTNSIQNIISNFVVEHVKSPQKHFEELKRMLKPGGYLIVAGPGDAYPSHRKPFNYFNVTRFGYLELIKDNGLELIEEYFPGKSWASILYLCYTTIVRNSYYNKNQFTKILQMIVFFISLLISPILNLIALLFDRITPFDKTIYSVYMALLRKPDN